MEKISWNNLDGVCVCVCVPNGKRKQLMRRKHVSFNTNEKERKLELNVCTYAHAHTHTRHNRNRMVVCVFVMYPTTHENRGCIWNWFVSAQLYVRIQYKPWNECVDYFAAQREKKDTPSHHIDKTLWMAHIFSYQGIVCIFAMSRISLMNIFEPKEFQYFSVDYIFCLSLSLGRMTRNK